ncbi:MAG TPA: response regulator [Streptosporangiaceae bacterium]
MNVTEAARSRGRILLVEDDAEAAFFAAHALTTMGGFDVIHTFDPVAALERARSEPWDLVLTDMDLPGMTGLELLEALRRSDPELPVAVITAHVSADPLTEILRKRADAFLEKPVPPARLTAVASSLIARSRSRSPIPEE